MADADRLLGMYLHLARASKLRRQPLVRVKLLVISAVQAEQMGLTQIAALCRHRVLAQNPRHLVRRWPTIGEALSTEAFQSHVKQLYRRYSPEKVEHMLASLGIEMGRERAAYFSDAEYAAALLDTRLENVGDVLSRDPVRRPVTTRSDAPAQSRERAIGDGLIVWGPFIGGLVLLAALAIASQSLHL